MQRAAGGMDDAFGDAGGARGKQDVEGMVEGQRLEFDRARLMRGDEVLQRDAVQHLRNERVGLADIFDQDRPPRRELLRHRGEFLGNVLQPAVVPVAVAGDEEHGLDLAEAVEDAPLAEIGGAGGPDRADGGGGQHAGDRLGHVRHHRGDAVALPHAGGAKGLLQAGDERVQLVPAHATAHLVLAAEDQRVVRSRTCAAGSRRN